MSRLKERLVVEKDVFLRGYYSLHHRRERDGAIYFDRVLATSKSKIDLIDVKYGKQK